MTDATEQLIKQNKELEKRNFGLHKLISELKEENARLKAVKEKTYNYDYLSECYSKFIKENKELKKQLMASNNWVKAFYAYEKSNFVRRKVAAHIKEVEKIMRELNK